MLKSAVEFLNKTFSGFMHKCPYSNIQIDNATFSPENNNDSNSKYWSLSPYPNGVVKTFYHAFDDEDDDIVTLITYNEVYKRELVFNDKSFMD
jgi:hypothetical protein